MAGLRRHAAPPVDEVAHASGPSIVSRGGETEITKLSAQFSQEFRRLGESCLRIEGIEQSALCGRIWHELRDPLRPMTSARRRPDRVGLEPALLPDHAGDEFKWQSVGGGCRFEDQAHRVGQSAGLCGIACLRLRCSKLVSTLRLSSFGSGGRRGLLDRRFFLGCIWIVLHKIIRGG